METRGQHTDDDVRFAIEGDRLSQGRGASGVAFLPRGVTQHDGTRRGRRIFASAKIAAQHRRQSQRPEESRGHCRAAHHLGAGVRAQRKAGALEHVHRGEDLVEPFPVEVVGIRQRTARTELDGLEKANQPGRIAIRQRLDQCGIHKREDGDTGAQAQRQHQHRGRGEARISAQLPEGVARIAAQIFQNRNGAPVAVSFLGGFDTAQLQDGSAARLICGHAGTQVGGDLQLEMRLDFIRQLAFAAGGWP